MRGLWKGKGRQTSGWGTGEGLSGGSPHGCVSSLSFPPAQRPREHCKSGVGTRGQRPAQEQVTHCTRSTLLPPHGTALGELPPLSLRTPALLLSLCGLCDLPPVLCSFCVTTRVHFAPWAEFPHCRGLADIRACGGAGQGRAAPRTEPVAALVKAKRTSSDTKRCTPRPQKCPSRFS